MSLHPGDVVEGRYTVEKLVGTGGLAEVYRVKHMHLGSIHALKILTVRSTRMHDRLLQEGRVQAGLRHTNVVNVTDVVNVDGSPGLVMDFVEGPSMERLLDHWKLSWAQIDVIGRRVLTAVAHAHKTGLVHRDIKPANVLIAIEDDDLVPKVADFGLAKIVGDEGGMKLTRSGITMGTPAYMPPEQARDAKNVDARADVWSLGVLLYEMVTSERAFDGPDIMAIFAAIGEAKFAPIRDHAPDVPERMERVILGALRVDPADRFPDAQAMLDAWMEGVTETRATIGDVPGGKEMIRAARQCGHDSLVTYFDQPISSVSSSKPSATYTPEPQRVLGMSMPVAVVVGAVSLASALGFAVAGMWWASQSEVAAQTAVVQPLTSESPVAKKASPAEVPASLPVEPVAVVAVDGPKAKAPRPKPVAAVPLVPLVETAPTTGTVSVTGVSRVWLVSPAGRFPAGDVPPGTYDIQAFFDESHPESAGRVTVAAGQKVTLRCAAELMVCR